MKKIDIESYGEFRGSTETTLHQILEEIKNLRQDVRDLQFWKAWTLGASAVAGFIAGFIRDFFIKGK